MSSLRDDFKAFQAKGAAILPLNQASAETHKSFVEKFQFPFPILSDPENKVATSYGAIKENGGIARSVYVIGKDGKVAWAKAGLPPDEDILKGISE